jgi:hypothetical protein
MEWGVLVQRAMSPRFVVIARVGLQDPVEVPFAQDNNMVGALATDRSNQPFGEAVLPGRTCGNGLVTNAHGPHSSCDGGTVDPVAIADQVARSLIPREGLCDLACNPFRSRVCRDVDPDEVSARQPDDDEDVEQVEANGRNIEQIQGGMSGAWLRRKVRHPWDGGPQRLSMYFATLD